MTGVQTCALPIYEISLALIEFHITHPKIELSPFMNDELVVIASIQSCLRSKNEASIEEMTNFPLILREEGSGTRHIMEETLNSLNVKVDSFPSHLVLGSNQAIKVAVQSGLGISILSQSAVAKECEYGMLHSLRIIGKNIERYFYLATLKGVNMDLLAKLFTEMLKTNKGKNYTR